MKCDKCKKQFKDNEITVLKDSAENNFKIIGYFCSECLKDELS